MSAAAPADAVRLSSSEFADLFYEVTQGPFGTRSAPRYDSAFEALRCGHLYLVTYGGAEGTSMAGGTVVELHNSMNLVLVDRFDVASGFLYTRLQLDADSCAAAVSAPAGPMFSCVAGGVRFELYGGSTGAPPFVFVAASTATRTIRRGPTRPDRCVAEMSNDDVVCLARRLLEATGPRQAPGGRCISFSLNEKESKSARAFLEEHRHPEARKGAIGGHITYAITPTSLGATVGVSCCVCGATADVTDCEDW